MMLDLIEITPRKLNIKKIILCIAIILIIIAILAVFLYKHIEYRKLILAQKEEQMVSKQTYFTHKITYKQQIKQTKSIIAQVNSIYESEGKRAFLTFDDGPSQTVTPLLLDYLKQENIKVTFFLLGSRVELNPSIVKREYEEGHYLANHGYSHIYSNIYQSPQSVIDEYNLTEQAIKNAIGKQDYNSYLFRFPGGINGGKSNNLKHEAGAILEQCGVAHIDWNALTGDAEGKNTIEEMLDYVKATINDKNSVVILMHDASDKILTYEMLPQLVQYLRENGYEFKNMYDLIE